MTKRPNRIDSVILLSVLAVGVTRAEAARDRTPPATPTNLGMICMSAHGAEGQPACILDGRSPS